ncbi:UPF0481 protein At3g47200-like [Vicia villosa]|uniref:UPF0481 protein At3g47200-like n=1 Tax=Vicia villosa TaxID=3911 RepID=UPI00273B5E28|nr:UPF0481 protein At3g47200-like [Vicia villosa]
MMASQITLDEKFLEFENAKLTHQNSQAMIQKVPQNLRNRNKYDKYYSPTTVSIGPIHHDNKNLKIGDNYKFTFAAKYVKKTTYSPQLLHKKIADNISELKGLFAEDVLALANNSESLQGFGSLDEKLSWLLFVDGCFLLYLMDDDNTQLDDEEVSFKHTQLFYDVMTDVLLLENQLPYLVLKLLWKNDNEKELIETMVDFIPDHGIWYSPYMDLRNEPAEPPIHLLDLRHTLILTKSDLKMKMKEHSSKYPNLDTLMANRNIEDLTAIGIKLKSSGTRNPLSIDFSEGWFSAELTLPEICMNYTTIGTLLNLTAYEMCQRFNHQYEICTFVIFINSLIGHSEDVKKLRSESILRNFLGRDEDVADFFNVISTDLLCSGDLYEEVNDKIYEHRFKKSKIWLAMAYRTYFSNPWAIIGLLAGVIALVLTFLQTWFSIKPR